MPVERDELEEIFKMFLGWVDERIGTRATMPTPNQPSSSQSPQQSTPPSDSENKEEKKWGVFFDKNGIVDQDQQTVWRDNFLTPDNAQKVWNNGWKDLTEGGGITNLDEGKASYTSKDKTTNKDETTDEIDLSEYKRESLKKVHRFIIDMKSKGLPSFSDEDIKVVVKNLTLPASMNYEALKEMRDGRVKELFKEGFEKNNKNHGISGNDKDDKIDAWRTNDTGLGGNGTNERKAFDNGWTKPEEIKNAKLASYTTPDTNQTTIDIDVLAINKDELDKAHTLLFEIKATKGLKELKDWKKIMQKELKN